MYLNEIKSILFGVCVGDALGVPVEGMSREMLSQNPVNDMQGYATYNMPPGSFSDDSSLTFCLAEMLTGTFDLNILAQYFINWLDHAYWTATDYTFGIGRTTAQAINRLKQGVSPQCSGGTSVIDNGNGALMRILPLIIYSRNLPIEQRFALTKQVSAITHAHIRSTLACFYYLEFAGQLLLHKDKFTIYKLLQAEFIRLFDVLAIPELEQQALHNLILNNIYDFSIDQIKSDGYVIHTLEASIWCLLTTNNYQEAVLQAVNLGYDTDTTSAVTGGLAGLLYGYVTIPKHWLIQIAKVDAINDLALRLAKKYN